MKNRFKNRVLPNSPLYVDYKLSTFIYSYLPKTLRFQMADEPLQ